MSSIFYVTENNGWPRRWRTTENNGWPRRWRTNDGDGDQMMHIDIPYGCTMQQWA